MSLHCVLGRYKTVTETVTPATALARSAYSSTLADALI